MSSFADDLRKAISAHDIAATVSCFTEDCRCDFPVHRGRGFVGQELLYTYWAWLFTRVPDIEAHVVRSVSDGGAVWSEWELSGSDADGAPQLTRGVIIAEVDGDQAEQVHFYLDPVD